MEGTLDFEEFLILHNKIKNAKNGRCSTLFNKANKGLSQMSEKMKEHLDEQERFKKWKILNSNNEMIKNGSLSRKKQLIIFRKEEEFDRKKNLLARQATFADDYDKVKLGELFGGPPSSSGSSQQWIHRQ